MAQQDSTQEAPPEGAGVGATEALKEGKAWQGGDPERGFQKSWEWAQGWKPALEGAAPHPHPRVCRNPALAQTPASGPPGTGRRVFAGPLLCY